MNTDPVYLPKIRIERGDGGESSWRFTGKTMGLFLLLLILGSLMGSFYLNQASQAATAGLEVLHLVEQREVLRQENAELRKQIAEMEALSNIRGRAEELGFRERERAEYLIIDNIPLERPDQETSASTPAGDGNLDEPRSMSSELARWWEELTAQFESWMNIDP